MNGESAQAQRIIDQADFRGQSSEVVLWHTRTDSADNADFKSALQELKAGFEATGRGADRVRDICKGSACHDARAGPSAT